MSHKRPVYLNLFAFRFPITAIISILHRVSGVVLFLGFIPLLLLWYQSLQSPRHFDWVISYLNSPVMLLLIWLFWVSLAFHLIAGVRHLLMDVGIGESAYGGKMGSWIVFMTTILCAIFGIVILL